MMGDMQEPQHYDMLGRPAPQGRAHEPISLYAMKNEWGNFVIIPAAEYEMKRKTGQKP